MRPPARRARGNAARARREGTPRGHAARARREGTPRGNAAREVPQGTRPSSRTRNSGFTWLHVPIGIFTTLFFFQKRLVFMSHLLFGDWAKHFTSEAGRTNQRMRRRSRGLRSGRGRLHCPVAWYTCCRWGRLRSCWARPSTRGGRLALGPTRLPPATQRGAARTAPSSTPRRTAFLRFFYPQHAPQKRQNGRQVLLQLHPARPHRP